MTDWLADLHDKAGKAQEFLEQFNGPSWHTPGDLYDDCLNYEECEYVAACSPERVRVLCELAEAARDIPHCHTLFPEHCDLCSALAALASLEPAREEET